VFGSPKKYRREARPEIINIFVLCFDNTTFTEKGLSIRKIKAEGRNMGAHFSFVLSIFSYQITIMYKALVVLKA